MTGQGSLPPWTGETPDAWGRPAPTTSADPWGVPSHRLPPTGPHPVDATVLGPGQASGTGAPWGPGPQGWPAGPPGQPAEPAPSVVPTVLVTLLFGFFGLIPAIMGADRSRRVGRPASRIWTAFVASLVVAVSVQATVAVLVVWPRLPFSQPTTATSATTYSGTAETTSPGNPAGSQPAVPPTMPTAPATTAPATTAPATTAPATFPPGATPCSATTGSIGGFSQSAAGTDVTSCPFAETVRSAYGSQAVRGSAVTIQAYSPVTRKNYAMACSGSGLVTCVGGTNAVVYLLP